MKILLVEDEKKLAAAVLDFLRSEGHVCEWAEDSITADEKIGVYEYDCALVDIMLPDGSGLDLIKKMKEARSRAGIIIISAKNSVNDKISGLNLGADDYLTKPFHLSELNARLNSVQRRRQFDGNPEIIFDQIKVLPDAKEVWVGQNRVTLTRKEYDLLTYLLANPGRVLTKGAISEHLYGDDIDQVDCFDFLYSQMKNLRKKLAENGSPDYIQTIYGVGYKLTA
ncbi:response regulator transcription factor [Persicitalea jodogahamensis]|uniref:DNA-binding response regulator n=1 Tax=Persicitalea jodogahamensis TaxID=402147 RepID=A0A8J3G7W8_9BACT|nr:response regulator transcription factor [Persicitalea jodogahamensis]GHB60629.1 DNA-binding response regulator [Persicitalea jodogahamensis]